ncbi:hypothetical protein BKA70DRAFT_1156221 [Coprinopsis sp. MPI-PUGE-AT-0042]|nr:hypothetical protein BKA70DRAFT_1156221 [Coprinopsis sp. MPI-PUGE-AT-0042]
MGYTSVTTTPMSPQVLSGSDGQVPSIRTGSGQFLSIVGDFDSLGEQAFQSRWKTFAKYDTIQVLEAFQMLELEVDLIWKATTWGWIKGLYIANRTVPFILLLFTAIPFGLRNPSSRLCDGVAGTAIIAIPVSLLLAEAILYIRLFALSGCQRWMQIFLYVHAPIVTIGALVPVSLFAKQVSWGPSEYPSNPYGCYIRRTKNIFAVVSYGILLYSGLGWIAPRHQLKQNAESRLLVTMALSVYFGVRNYWTMRDNALIRVFYRDGTFYFIVLAGMAIANGLAALLLPVGYQFLLGPLQAAVHSILVTRMVLDVKAQGRSEMSAYRESDGPPSWSSTARMGFR